LIITCLRRSLCLLDFSNLQSLPINIQLSKTSSRLPGLQARRDRHGITNLKKHAGKPEGTRLRIPPFIALSG
jgi:hypothetical protein